MPAADGGAVDSLGDMTDDVRPGPWKMALVAVLGVIAVTEPAHGSARVNSTGGIETDSAVDISTALAITWSLCGMAL